MQIQKSKSNNFNLIKKTLFFAIWIGIFIKMLIFDWDIYLFNTYFPNYTWILNYKIMIIVILILITSKMKIKYILLNALYFIFFPIIFIFYLLPATLYSKWEYNGIIVYINSILILLKNFRFKFIFCVFYIIMFNVILHNQNKIFLIIATIFFCCSVVIMIYSMFKVVFGKDDLFVLYKKISTFITKLSQNSSDEFETITDLTTLKKEDQIVTKLELSVLNNRIFLFASKKYREFNKSKFYSLQDIIVLLVITIVGVCSLSLINFGLYQIDMNNFATTEHVIFMDFILYTIFQSNGAIIAKSTLSKLLIIITCILYLCFTALFFGIFINRNKEKQQNEINEMIDTFEGVANVEETRLTKTSCFNNIDSAIDALKTLESSFIEIIEWFTRHL